MTALSASKDFLNLMHIVNINFSIFGNAWIIVYVIIVVSEVNLRVCSFFQSIEETFERKERGLFN
jgi:hypothetical protein